MNNFKESEIKGYTYIDGRKVTYLKSKVKRIDKYEALDDNKMDHLNQKVILLEKWEYFNKYILGEDDFTN